MSRIHAMFAAETLAGESVSPTAVRACRLLRVPLHDASPRVAV
ncbi:hypothetical protein XOCgx_0688 [Xanthomonas oryzae pv. oryzicola]|nr:hypothetical protein XOCgx_0688 [Xanthomonas oryzae pv. oryzicola]